MILNFEYIHIFINLDSKELEEYISTVAILDDFLLTGEIIIPITNKNIKSINEILDIIEKEEGDCLNIYFGQPNITFYKKKSIGLRYCPLTNFNLRFRTEDKLVPSTDRVWGFYHTKFSLDKFYLCVDTFKDGNFSQRIVEFVTKANFKITYLKPSFLSRSLNYLMSFLKNDAEDTKDAKDTKDSIKLIKSKKD